MSLITQHIEISPDIAGGKPRIAGHRITVQNVVIWHERMGLSADEIASTYGLSLADVYACLLYTSPSPRDRTRSRMPSCA